LSAQKEIVPLARIKNSMQLLQQLFFYYLFWRPLGQIEESGFAGASVDFEGYFFKLYIFSSFFLDGMKKLVHYFVF
jgi:hypothetical protein